MSSIKVIDLEEVCNSKNMENVYQIIQPGCYSRIPMLYVDMAEIDKDQIDIFEKYMSITKQNYESTNVYEIKNAKIIGQGSVLIDDFNLIKESCLEFIAHNRVPDGFYKDENEEIKISNEEIREIDNPSILLQRPWFENYGHWLVDSAVILSLCSKIPFEENWTIIVGKQQSNSMRMIVMETIKKICPNVNFLEKPKDEVWKISKLYYITPLHVPPLYKNPVSLSLLKATLELGSTNSRSSYRKLFIRRGDGVSRSLSNENEVIEFLKKYDFEIIDLKNLSLMEQIKLYRSAYIVVSIKGAALTNSMFMTVGSHVLSISPSDFPDPFFWDLSSQIGINYSEIFGSLVSRNLPQGQNSFFIDIKRLERALNVILSKKIEK